MPAQLIRSWPENPRPLYLEEPAVIRLLAIGLLVAWTPLVVRGEVFHLASGGIVRGEIANKNEEPRENYVIKTASGGQVTLSAAQVETVDHQSPAEIKYDRLKVSTPDTAKGNWELAEYCRENHLADLRKEHLERIIEIEPDHADARHALKYTHVKGKWITQQQGMDSEGRKLYGGEWLMQQEIDLREGKRKAMLAEKKWFQDIKRYRGWIDRGRSEQGREKIAAINDPLATKGLEHYLASESDRELKMMWVDALARVGAMDALVTASLIQADEEVRIACMEKLAAAKYKLAVRRYVQALKSKDNAMVNQAAVGLAYMKDPSAVPSLIDSLITKHKYTIQPGGQPGQMSSSFGSGAGGGGGPGGFSFGQPQPVTVEQKHQNTEVLRTLVGLAGVNFDYDVPAWKYWYASQKSPASLDARRD